jgi:hypothetical protein
MEQNSKLLVALSKGGSSGEWQGPGSQHSNAVLTWISKNKPQCLSLQTPLQNY